VVDGNHIIAGALCEGEIGEGFIVRGGTEIKYIESQKV